MPSADNTANQFFALPGCKESVMRSVKVYEEAAIAYPVCDLPWQPK